MSTDGGGHAAGQGGVCVAEASAPPDRKRRPPTKGQFTANQVNSRQSTQFFHPPITVEYLIIYNGGYLHPPTAHPLTVARLSGTARPPEDNPTESPKILCFSREGDTMPSALLRRHARRAIQCRRPTIPCQTLPPDRLSTGKPPHVEYITIDGRRYLARCRKYANLTTRGKIL